LSGFAGVREKERTVDLKVRDPEQLKLVCEGGSDPF